MPLGPRSIAVSHRVVLCVAQFPGDSVGPVRVVRETEACSLCPDDSVLGGSGRYTPLSRDVTNALRKRSTAIGIPLSPSVPSARQTHSGSGCVPATSGGAYGPADYDIRHSFNANYIWEIPLKALLGNHGSDYLMSGWQISGTIFARGGFRYAVYDNFRSGVLSATKNFGGQLYAVPAHPLGKQLPCGPEAVIPAVPRPCQIPLTLSDGTPNLAADFIQPGCITDFNTGNLPNPLDLSEPCGGQAVTFARGRNRFHGPHYFSADLAVMKNTRARPLHSEDVLTSRVQLAF